MKEVPDFYDIFGERAGVGEKAGQGGVCVVHGAGLRGVVVCIVHEGGSQGRLNVVHVAVM